MSKEKTAIEITRPQTPEIAKEIERVLIQGDLSKLNEQQLVDYYLTTCKSLGLNPLTQPFNYLILNGKKVLYATKNCTEQLRKINGVSVTDIVESTVEGVFIIKVKGTDKSGRMDASTGAVNIATLRGEALANAMMKAETKAKRRFTLSICGLGMLDETEVETIPGAVVEPAKVAETNISQAEPAVVSPPPKPAASATPPRPAPASVQTKPPAAKPVPSGTPAKPTKAEIPIQPAAAPTPAATAPTPTNGKTVQQRAREFCNTAAVSSTNLMTFVCKHLGVEASAIGTVERRCLTGTMFALEVTLEKFGPKPIAVFVKDEVGADASVKSYFQMAYAKSQS
jgi:hypothetical protein